jgi:ribonuclease PH
MNRPDGREMDCLRKVNVIEDFVSCAEASIMIEIGRTRVLCNATIDGKVPKWFKEKEGGWVTGEYSLLPRSTGIRVRRERGVVSGRTQEIQRLIGRSLRGVCDLSALGDRTITIDCDVLEADGGTRTASVVGGFMALVRPYAGSPTGGKANLLLSDTGWPPPAWELYRGSRSWTCVMRRTWQRKST